MEREELHNPSNDRDTWKRRYLDIQKEIGGLRRQNKAFCRSNSSLKKAKDGLGPVRGERDRLAADLE
jgi:hypothetical protein